MPGQSSVVSSINDMRRRLDEQEKIVNSLQTKLNAIGDVFR
jgi:hypothetical protein